MPNPVSYSEYLKTNQLLEIQKPLSAVGAQGLPAGTGAHDEMLFIVVHQAHELWFKQILHELQSVLNVFTQERVDEKNMGMCVSRLSRVTDIQKVLIDHVRILETMTPLDFLEFRDFISPASGFQSLQFRLLETKLGLQRESAFHSPKSPFVMSLSQAELAQIHAAENTQSLFELVEKWLERTPFLDTEGYTFWKSYRNAVQGRIINDRRAIENHPGLDSEYKSRQLDEIRKTEISFEALFDEKMYSELLVEGQKRLSLRATHAALFIHLYRDEPILQLPFKLITLLVDIDELLQSWRSQHALMVHRMIGTKVGTGGSLGYHYLRTTIEKNKIFSDFFNLSTFLIPRSLLPELPAELHRKLGFVSSP